MLMRCPRCSGRGVEPIYGRYFDHDGDSYPVAWATCSLCRGTKQIEALYPAPTEERRVR